jgi:hypothetical protein
MLDKDRPSDGAFYRDTLSNDGALDRCIMSNPHMPSANLTMHATINPDVVLRDDIATYDGAFRYRACGRSQIGFGRFIVFDGASGALMSWRKQFQLSLS